MKSGRYERVNYTYLKLVSICPEIEDTKRLNTATVTTLLKTSFLAKKIHCTGQILTGVNNTFLLQVKIKFRLPKINLR